MAAVPDTVGKFVSGYINNGSSREICKLRNKGILFIMAII